MKVNFQRIALGKLLDGNVEILQELDASMFVGKELKIYDLILEKYSETSKLPSRLAISATINDRAPRAVSGPFQALVEALPDNHEDILDEDMVEGLKGSRTLRMVDDKFEELLEAQRDRDFNKVKDLLASTLQEVSLGGVKIDSLSDVMDNDEVIHSVPSGFGERIDETLGNRFSGVTVITAGTGGGKSVVLLASAIEAFREGQAVVFVSLELSAKALGSRLKAYVSGIDFNKIIKDTLTDSERADLASCMVAFWGDRKDDFKIITEQLDDKELLAMVSVQAQTSNVQAVYVDYLGLVGSSSAGEGWKSLANLVKALHKQTMKYGLVVVTAAQVAEAKIEGNNVTLVSRGSAELVFSASVALYLKKMDDEEDEAYVVYVAKNRYGRPIHTIVEGQLQFMKFKDAGISLNE